MSAIKLDKFGGCLPAWDDRLLPDGQAALSLNCYLFSGALVGWRQPKLLHALKNSAARYAYRIPSVATNDTSITAPDSFWMEFTDPDTTVMRSPVVQDSFNRHYWASPSDLPRYNTYDRILAGDPSWILGVPASGCAPGVTVDGGGDTIQVGDSVVLPNAVGAGADYRPGNEIFLIPIVPNGTLLIQDVSFVPASTDGALNFQAVVYSDLNGHPDRLIGVGDQITGISAGATATGTFTNAVSVISNTTYWIGIAHDNPLYLTVADTSVSTGAAVSNTFSNDPPDPAAAALGYPVWQMWGDLIGASVFTARAYTYTWVTAYGEEGPPSVPSVVNGWSNATWTVSLFTPEPSDMGVDRNITKTRLYRSISNQTGQGTYFLVAEFPVTQATYVDTIDDATVALNAQLVSLYWFAPPTDLQGIVPFPNGIAVGWRSNEVWFSEAYRPHAWPPGYVLTTEFPIVGIGVCGQSIVVCTQSAPYLISGINPSAMALTKINLPEPCLHRGSIVSTDTTVLYASRNGLIQISQSGAGSNITEGWVTRERWQALTPQKYIRAVKLATNYMAFGTVSGGDNSVAQQGFTVELSTQDQTSFTVWPQPGGHRLGFGQLSAPNGFDIDNCLLDPWTGVGLLVQNGGVYHWDFADQAPVIVPYRWRSKVYQQLSRKNFAACKVWFSVPPGTPPQTDRDTDDPQPELGPSQYGIIRVYADDELFTTRELRTSGELLRIYSGEKVEAWQFEIEGRVTVSNLQVATSVKELGLI
jgi:hypothetical protein